jgi:hypothetical protein
MEQSLIGESQGLFGILLIKRKNAKNAGSKYSLKKISTYMQI